MPLVLPSIQFHICHLILCLHRWRTYTSHPFHNLLPYLCHHLFSSRSLSLAVCFYFVFVTKYNINLTIENAVENYSFRFKHNSTEKTYWNVMRSNWIAIIHLFKEEKNHGLMHWQLLTIRLKPKYIGIDLAIRFISIISTK